ncbi:MAG: SHOCT domain-containing protein [Thermomicrobiales bacterium]|nr:SHOCT domain-containing protein [Thermomicrobiales bacterium]
MAQLEQLSTMQAAGLLTTEQFEAAKNKLLGL